MRINNRQLFLNLTILLAIPLTIIAIIALTSGGSDQVALVFDYVTTSSIQ